MTAFNKAIYRGPVIASAEAPPVLCSNEGGSHPFTCALFHRSTHCQKLEQDLVVERNSNFMQVMATRNSKMHQVRLVVYHIIYDGFVATSQVVGNGISEPSTVAKSFGNFVKGSSA